MIKFGGQWLYSVAVITSDSELISQIPGTPVRFRVRPTHYFWTRLLKKQASDHLYLMVRTVEVSLTRALLFADSLTTVNRGLEAQGSS